MKPKYDVDIIINNISNKGVMEVFDNYLKLNVGNQERIIEYKNIKENSLENNLIKVTLNDNVIMYIRTIEANIINEFIFLQKDDNYPIKFTTKSEYNIRRYFTSLVIIFLVIWLLSGFVMSGFLIFVYFCFSLIFAFPATLVINANSSNKDRANSYCPHCHNNIRLQYNIANVVSSVFENDIGTFPCKSCGNIVGMKYNHLYKVTPQNEHFFVKEYKPLIKQQESNVNISNNTKETEIEKLEKIKELLDKNLITQEEFDKKKQEILNKI